MSKHCADCRDGEHENYDDDVKLVMVKAPDERQFLKRAYMCGEHRDMYEGDGYEVKIQ
jgi:hypothetical protein